MSSTVHLNSQMEDRGNDGYDGNDRIELGDSSAGLDTKIIGNIIIACHYNWG
jgi:hypothetical protein